MLEETAGWRAQQNAPAASAAAPGEARESEQLLQPLQSAPGQALLSHARNTASRSRAKDMGDFKVRGRPSLWGARGLGQGSGANKEGFEQSSSWACPGASGPAELFASELPFPLPCKREGNACPVEGGEDFCRFRPCLLSRLSTSSVLQAPRGMSFQPEPPSESVAENRV